MQKMRILSGSSLKLIAVITMLIDHIAAVLLIEFEPAFVPLLSIAGREITVYYIFRKIGRIAFPIFCFLVTEGFIHTKSRKKYGRNLLIFAFVSEIPYNLAIMGKFFAFDRQNVFFTLFLGFLALYVLESNIGQFKKFICTFAIMWAATVLNSDYGFAGTAIIVLIYYLREKRILQAILALPMLSGGLAAWSAFIPINMYNGSRGFIKGNFAKYFFYAFYPLHLIILLIIKAGIF